MSSQTKVHPAPTKSKRPDETATTQTTAATNEKQSTTTDNKNKSTSQEQSVSVSSPESNAARLEAEKLAFPNDGKPPAEVTAFIEGTGDLFTNQDNEKEKCNNPCPLQKPIIRTIATSYPLYTTPQINRHMD